MPRKTSEDISKILEKIDSLFVVVRYSARGEGKYHGGLDAIYYGEEGCLCSIPPVMYETTHKEYCDKSGTPHRSLVLLAELLYQRGVIKDNQRRLIWD